VKEEALSKSPVETILRPGQIVGGQYRVDHLVARGGMAAVWAGTNQHTGKQVALKVILLSLANKGEAQSLFRSEALAASRVNHPNVVTVFDVIEHEGMACIVMELLDGESLASTIARKGRLSIDEAAALLLPAMRGVAAANAQGVIHRDLKPQNIFVCTEPDGRIVTTKVLDFGISVMLKRAIDPSAGPVVTAGTPAYMSPEHIRGVARIDARADVYGFGVLLYETLTGQTPFPGEPGPDLFDRILNQPLPSVTLLRPDLPPGLVRIIEKAMAKQPEQRYSDLNSMVNALEDELMPLTPPPRLLTPFAGVPSIATRDPASAEHAVQAILENGSSEPHQETRFLFRFSAKAARKKRAPQPGPILVDPRPSICKVVLAGTRSLSTPRRWRGMVGAGLAVVLGFFAVWMVMGGSITAQTAAQSPATNPKAPSGKPVDNAALPLAASTATIVPVPVPPPVVPAPLAPSTPTPVKPSQPTARTVHASRPQSAAPRAGRLSATDF
jgi:eukaryotic-like serine/threonine-protein kinase